MATTNPGQRLKTLLAQHVVGETPNSAIAAWEAFKSFGREVVGQKGVGLLFQVGTYRFSGAPLFYFNPVVQFEVLDDEGEHDHYEQTHCELTGPAADALKNVRCSLWSFDFATADAFYLAVEALPEFQLAIHHSPHSVNIFHEEV